MDFGRGWPLVFAHRGCSYRGFNQNTLRAFAQPIAEGARALECDVQCSRDGDLFVYHDLTLDRGSTGSGALSERSSAYLHSLYVGDPAQGRDPIPTLGQLLDLVAAYLPAERPLLNIELKGKSSGEPTAQLAGDYLRSGRLAARDLLFSSFLLDELAILRRRLPMAAVGMLMPIGDAPTVALRFADQLHACCLAAAYSDLDTALVSHCRAHEMRLFIFTINRRAEARRLIRMGCDGLFSDRWRHASRWLHAVR